MTVTITNKVKITCFFVMPNADSKTPVFMSSGISANVSDVELARVQAKAFARTWNSFQKLRTADDPGRNDVAVIRVSEAEMPIGDLWNPVELLTESFTARTADQ
jgi:hypothetical protein